MNVDDPSKLRTFLISVNRVISGGLKVMTVDTRLRGGQESGNHLQNIRIAFRSVIEPRGVNEDHPSSIEREFIRELHLGRTRFQAHSDP